MDSALLVHRLHFAFTITFHYLFPQLTMGLAPLILILKTLAATNNNKTRAAEILGISLKTLHNKLKEYGNSGHVAGETAN